MKHSFIIVAFFLSIFSYSQNPSLVWAKSQSGLYDDYTNAVTTDPSGNVFTTGYFQVLSDFDPGPSSYTLAGNGGYDVFISKLDPNGNFLWAKSFGSPFQDYSWSITLDGLGNVLVSGYFQDTVDFDPGIGTYTLASNGSDDFFVLKLDATGNFVWAISGGGGGGDWGCTLTTDALNNVYLGGRFGFTVDFDPGASNYNLSSTGSHDGFVLKLNSSGNFVWAKGIGGASADIIQSMAFDGIGNLVTTGCFNGTVDFDPGPSTYNFTSLGLTDLFILKLDLSGNFVWAKQVGSSNQDEGYAIKCDGLGNVIITGFFVSSADFDPGPLVYNLNPIGTCDAFVLKLSSSGAFIWAKAFGGTSVGISGYAIALDAANNIYFDGNLNGTVDFDPGLGVFNLTSLGNPDLFITSLDPNGNLNWARAISSPNTDFGFAINIDPFSNIIIGLYSSGTPDFDPALSTYTITPSITGSMDAYVVKWTLPPLAINNSDNEGRFSVFPNPNNGSFNLDINYSAENAVVVLVNSKGQTVHSQKAQKGNNVISTIGLSSGLYNYFLIQNNQKINDGKLIID